MTVVLKWRWLRPSHVTHAFVIIDICDPVSIRTRIRIHSPQSSFIRIHAVPRMTLTEEHEVPTNGLSDVVSDDKDETGTDTGNDEAVVN